MRLKNLIFGECRLLCKYGIVFLYLIFTTIYACLITVIPSSAKQVTVSILIFTDPAAMGLFFMGAMVLLEKSQRVESSLGVSPVKTSEYVAAKLIPFMMIATAVASILCLFAPPANIFLTLIGVALSSALLSLCGLLVSAHIKTLNSFLIATVPFEIVLCLPAVLWLFGFFKASVWIFHPGIAAIRLIYGDSQLWYLSVLSLVLWLIPVYFACKKAVAKSFSSMGGAKL